MNSQEFAALEAVERTHWFYRGKRKIARHWLKRLGIPDYPGDLVVDVGAGTGILLGELSKEHKALGIEYSPVGLKFAKQYFSANLIAGSALELPVVSGQAGAVIALDVIEHIEDDKRAVAEMARITRPGGCIIINVPAFQSLWSDWDVSLGHYRRYTRRMVLETVRQSGLSVYHVAYINWLPFIPILLYRRWRTSFPITGGRRLEDGLPPGWINAILETAFVRPACWSWFQPPAGVSVFCILKRDK